MMKNVGRSLARGFTLIELMMVTVIIAIVAAIAIPNLLSARMGANETAAIAILRTVATAEAQFQRAGYADENHDGQGEYGYLAELCGVVNVRGTTRKATSTLSTSVGIVTASGESQRSGFIFRMYLPQAAGVGYAEQPNGGAPAGVLDASNSNIYWACYAYPGHYGGTADRTFFVNQRCELMTTVDSRYQLPGCASLSAGAAMKEGLITHMTGQVAFATRGADGNFWKAVQ
jgi:prepilin-type N-terminal cleavage/methylation domain-containing protein